MNTEQKKALAIAEAKRKMAAGGGSSPAAPEQTGFFSSLGNAFRGTVDPILEGMGATAEVLGHDGLGQTLKDATSLPEGYVSGSEQFMNADEDGSFAWRHLPAAIGEQAGQFAGAIASRGLGAAGGFAVAGAPGAAVGGLAGPALFEAAQVLGPVAMERAKNNGREEPNWDDLKWAAGTAAGSGALNALAPGVSGPIKRALIEGGTEGVQSLVQQTGETGGTEKGLELDGRQALAEGIIGMGSAGAVDGAVAGTTAAAKGTVNAAKGIRIDQRDFTPDEVRAADRLLAAADHNPDVLANVNDTGEGSAKGAANAALRQVRSEAEVITSNLTKLAKARGDEGAVQKIKALSKTMSAQTTPTPQSFVDDLKTHFPNEPDVERLRSLHAEQNAIQKFTVNSAEDMGGFSKKTKNLDVTDNRNTNRFAAYALMGGAMGGSGGTLVPAAIGTAVSGTVMNRVAQKIDKLTNRRSAVKRFTDSAQASGVQPQDILGDTAADVLASEKAVQAAAKLAAKEAKQTSKQAAKPAVDQSKAEAQAQQYQMHNAATQGMFDADQANGNIAAQEPYAMWQDATGAGPDTTLQILEQLAREGKVPQDMPQRFREDIRSFPTKGADAQATYLAQELVRQRNDPSYENRDRVGKKKRPRSGEEALGALNAKITGRRGIDKAKEGERRFKNAVNAVEKAQKQMPADQFNGLMWLADSMNRPDITRGKRYEMMNETLAKIFPDNPAAVDFWKAQFGPLASIGNDKAIFKKEKSEKETFNEKKTKAKKRKAKRKSKRKPAVSTKKKARKSSITVPTAQQPETKADKALKLLQGPETPKALPKTETETDTDTGKHLKKTEPQVPPAKGKPKKAKGRKGLKDRINDRIEQIRYAVVVSEAERDDLSDYVENRLGKSSRDRVEAIFYDIASDRMTMDMVVDRFATLYDIPPAQAMEVVDNALRKMEEEGTIKRFRPKASGTMVSGGKPVKGPDGNYVSVVQIDPVDQNLKERLEVSKAIKMADKLVAQDGSHDDFNPNSLRDGEFYALKGVSPNRVDGSFTPLLNAVNYMRNTRHRVNPRIMEQINNGLGGTGKNKLGTIRDVLDIRDKNGKSDPSVLNTVAHLMFQTDEGDGTIRQEWFAGSNGRIYSRNGSAHSQAGDIMKGMLRAESPAPVGGEAGLNYVFHGIGNLLGFDKEAPKDRREAMFNNDMVDDLVKFADDPFGRLTLKDRNGNPTSVGTMVDDGEGFFQVLNAAHEVKSMVDFAKARHKDKSDWSATELLQDPDVRADLAQNYSTDFIVQLDASNNAYQIAGMVMGYEDVLKATGLLPQDVDNPDEVKGADIYLEPAMSIADRIPELASLGLPQQKLRKLFKGPIGTYLYAAEFSSRQEAFQDVLETISGDADVFGIDGDGLIPIPNETVEQMLSEDGAAFQVDRYNVDGEVKSSQLVQKRVKETEYKGETVYQIETAGPKGKFKTAAKRFETPEEAIKYSYGMDVYSRMNRELVREMNVRYPEMKRFLDYANVVSEVVKAKGGKDIVVPTRDGMELQYSFKENPVFDAKDIETADGKTIRAGFRTDETKMAGRGLAAFMTHQNDAWALRETMKRMPDMKTFNPIHDSFGFHPSDAEAGQKTWVDVMQELGGGDYNIFLQVLNANGITPEEFVAAGGDFSFILERQPVAPVDAKSIPTALS